MGMCSFQGFIHLHLMLIQSRHGDISEDTKCPYTFFESGVELLIFGSGHNFSLKSLDRGLALVCQQILNSQFFQNCRGNDNRHIFKHCLSLGIPANYLFSDIKY